MTLLPEIENWQSTLSFLDKPVPSNMVVEILEAGRRAPSVKNRQKWRFIVIDDPMQRKKIARSAYNQQHVIEAPLLIALCTTNVNYIMPNDIPAYPVDVAIAASFMMLQAKHIGLSVCPITMFQLAQMQETLSMPFSMRVVLLLSIGYGKPEDVQEKCPRQNIEDISSYNSW